MTRPVQHLSSRPFQFVSPVCTATVCTARACLLGALLILGLSCASTDNQGEQDLFRTAVAEGRLADAETLAQAALVEDPEDSVALRNLRDIEVMLHIEQARRLTFDGRPQTALDVLLMAQGIDPENPMLQVWVAKTRRQLAGEWLEVAQSLSGDAELQQAVAALRRALVYVPDDVRALDDLARAERRILYREDRSEESFWSGLAAMREGRLVSADRDLGISLLFNEENDNAARRREDVEASLAEEGLLTAQILEEQGLIFAASTGYGAVLRMEPTNAGALEGAERMRREVLAERHMRLAQMMILRGEFELASEELVEAKALTLARQDRVDQLEGDIEASRWESFLKRAKALYQDQRHDEAVVVLNALLEEVESYKNARQFRDSLVDDIAKVEELYASAMAETDNQERLLLLRQVQVLWVEYKDVPELIKGLNQ